MGDLNDDMGLSAHGRVHVRDSEDKLVEPCQGKRDSGKDTRSECGFQSFSSAHTFCKWSEIDF